MSLKARLRKWLEVPEKVIVPVERERREPSCAVDGHEWGALKQWVDGELVYRSRRCRRCGELDGEAV